MLVLTARGDRPATTTHADGPPRLRASQRRPSTTSWPRRGACAAGTLVTYSPKVFVPLTTLCRDVCGYCTFARPPRRGERAYLRRTRCSRSRGRGRRPAAPRRSSRSATGPRRATASRARSSPRWAARRRSSTSPRCAGRVLEETGLLPHLNPGVMSREELAALRPVAASMGIMLETTAERLAARGGPHWASPDKVPARAARDDRGSRASSRSRSRAGSWSGSARRARSESTRCSRCATLATEHGHLREVIVQNFRAKPGTRMAEHPDATLEEHLWSVAVARIVLGPDVHVQAPPNLAYDDFPLLLDAGIDDWGGVSPVTVDHVNPEAPWPEVERLRERVPRARARARPAPAALPRARRRRSTGGPIRPSRRRSGAPPTRTGSRARTAGRPGEPVAVPFVVGRDPVPVELAGDELGEDGARAALRGPRRGARARPRGRRPAAARGLWRRRDLRRHAERPVHERLLLPLRLLRLLEGQARREPARPGVPRPARGDRAAACGRPGSAAPRRSACRAGSTRRSPATTTRASSRAIKDAVPEIHVHAFSALEVWQGAATLGLDLEHVPRAAARPRASARCPARPRRSSTTRCARSSAPTR